MGYRSQVGFYIEFTKDPEEFIALMKLDGRDMFKQFLEYMYIENYPAVVKEENIAVGGVHFYHDSWKWYEDCRVGFTDLLQLAEDFDEGFKAKFVRVGEESDDVEEDWFNDDGYDLEYPYVVRTVETAMDLSKLKKVMEEENENNHSREPT